jgi:hypothetical protein
VGIFGNASTTLTGSPTYDVGNGGDPGPECTVGGGNAGGAGTATDKLGF